MHIRSTFQQKPYPSQNAIQAKTVLPKQSQDYFFKSNTKDTIPKNPWVSKLKFGIKERNAPKLTEDFDLIGRSADYQIPDTLNEYIQDLYLGKYGGEPLDRIVIETHLRQVQDTDVQNLISARIGSKTVNRGIIDNALRGIPTRKKPDVPFAIVQIACAMYLGDSQGKRWKPHEIADYFAKTEDQPIRKWVDDYGYPIDSSNIRKWTIELPPQNKKPLSKELRDYIRDLYSGNYDGPPLGIKEIIQHLNQTGDPYVERLMREYGKEISKNQVDSAVSGLQRHLRKPAPSGLVAAAIQLREETGSDARTARLLNNSLDPAIQDMVADFGPVTRDNVKSWYKNQFNNET